MNRTAPSGSGNTSHKIERVRNLLSFDQSFLRPLQRESTLSPLGQIPLVFEDSEGVQANQRPSQRIVGFDEAGRGSLAGPVTVACVHLDWNNMCLPGGDFRNGVLETYADLNDSKKVTKRVRERLYERIVAEFHYGIGFSSAIEIDRLGIVSACCLAALRAYQCLTSGPGHGLGSSLSLGVNTDIGLFDRGLSLGEEETKAAFSSSVQITKGDAKSFHIAAASILAKVRRDAIMCDLASRAEASSSAEASGFAEAYGFAEPYGFASHKGYGSAAHIAAIRQHGPSKFHRRTFLSRI